MTPWIKLEVTTPDKPEIVAMAARLRIDQDAVVGKCFRIWAWADQNSVNGHALPITADFIDKRLTAQKGFANAMRAVGWLSGEDGALTFPGFDRHNGATAKGRAESARRMAKSRDERNESATKDTAPRCEDVAENSQPKPQPDQIRSDQSMILSPSLPRGRERLVPVKPEGWPATEVAAIAAGGLAGVPPATAATYWHHCEGLSLFPPGSFASYVKSKQGFQQQDLADKKTIEAERHTLRGQAPARDPSRTLTSTPKKDGF